jgi:hypothetical protein
MKITEMMKALFDGKKIKKIDRDDVVYQFNNGELRDRNNNLVELDTLNPAEFELLKERQFVYQWCFYNAESNDWVINPTLMTDEKAKEEFEKASITEDMYFKTGIKFNLIFPN